MIEGWARFSYSRVDVGRQWCDACRPLDPMPDGQGPSRFMPKCTCRRVPQHPIDPAWNEHVAYAWMHG